jgi:hypothetical protein
MPRITNLIPMDGGRLACILEPQDIVRDPGCITLWTNEEKDAEIAVHVKLEREACAAIADGVVCHLESHGYDTNAVQDVADAIRERSNEH